MRVRTGLLLWVAVLLVVVKTGLCGDLELSAGGKSSYRIVVGLDGSVQDHHAAEVLQRYLKEISGAELPIINDDNVLGDREIVLGCNRHVDLLDARLRREPFGEEAFRIKTVGKHLIIVGGSPRGVLYGVNSLLTEEFNCRWFTPQLRRIPKQERLVLAPTDRRYEPDFEWRDVFFWSGIDNEWSFHNFLNKKFAKLRHEQGGRGGFAWRQHTALQLIEPERYLEEHPEYFWKGNDEQPRTGGNNGLGICLNHPAVPRIAAARLLEERRKSPAGDLYYCLSAPDRAAWCECNHCQSFHKQQSGGVLPKVPAQWNHGADWFNFATRVQTLLRNHPNPPKISVMAYGYHPSPPYNPVMHKDMHVFYAELVASQFHRLDDPQNNSTFQQRLKGWLQCAGSVYVWLYQVNFSESWCFVHPNMHTLSDDFRYLRRLGVKGVFAQGNQMAWWGQRFAGEMNELRAYLLARLLWNPDLDWRAERRDFCAAYYGPAAGRVIEAYLDDLTAAFVKHNVAGPATLMNDATFSWITPDMFARWYAYMDEAESLAVDKEHKRLVRIARLPIAFTEAHCQKDTAKRKAMLQSYLHTARPLGAAVLVGENQHFIDWSRRRGLQY
ncbi:MAG: DUF4838 domain-containing protein [Planctomycetota bacterium]|nr:DUF4838 domain-containing protein [Planctomycetota bacterium]